MGGCSGSKYASAVVDERENKVFSLLGLQKSNVNKLYKVFAEVDKDGSGELSLFELLDYLKLRKTPFSARVFSIFDEDQSGEIDFREFVLALWNYCTLTKASLLIFAFDLYDYDGSGTIEVNEMVEMCKDVYGHGYAKNRLAVQILEKIERMNDIASAGKGEVTVERFAMFCENHPGLLYPAFSFQQALRKSVIGVRFWEKLAKERLTLPTGVQVKVQDILKAHVDENVFKSLCEKDKGRNLTKEERRQARQNLTNQVNGSFRDVFEHSGGVAQRRTTHQKSLGRAQNKLKAARTFRLAASGLGKAGAAGAQGLNKMPPTIENETKRKGSLTKTKVPDQHVKKNKSKRPSRVRGNVRGNVVHPR